MTGYHGVKIASIGRIRGWAIAPGRA